MGKNVLYSVGPRKISVRSNEGVWSGKRKFRMAAISYRILNRIIIIILKMPSRWCGHSKRTNYLGERSNNNITVQLFNIASGVYREPITEGIYLLDKKKKLNPKKARCRTIFFSKRDRTLKTVKTTAATGGTLNCNFII